MDSSKAPLLDSFAQSESESQVSPCSSCSSRRANSSSSRWRQWILYSIIAVETILCIFLATRTSISWPSPPAKPPTDSPSPSITVPPSPADTILSYRAQYFSKYGYRTSPFAQVPGPAVDAAWHALLSGMNIRVDASYLSPYNATSLPLRDGDGVAAQLGMYHELHCVKRLKHWVHREHYHAGLEPGEEAFVEAETHVEHCLEWLRVAAMCRGDTTLTTLRYEGATGKIETEYPLQRTCVDVEALMEWSEGRRVDIGRDVVPFRGS